MARLIFTIPLLGRGRSAGGGAFLWNRVGTAFKNAPLFTVASHEQRPLQLLRIYRIQDLSATLGSLQLGRLVGPPHPSAGRGGPGPDPSSSRQPAACCRRNHGDRTAPSDAAPVSASDDARFPLPRGPVDLLQTYVVIVRWSPQEISLDGLSSGRR